MKFIKPINSEDPRGEYRLELTRRNLQALLDKLDDPLSVRTLFKDGISVIAVEDEEHYGDRAPGVVFMPTSGEIR